MRNTGSWIAFLVTLFLAVGLCGMFASYAVTIPLDRAAAREAMLDEVLTADDPATAVQRLRPRLGSLEAPLAAAGPWAQRVAAARAVVTGEARRGECQHRVPGSADAGRGDRHRGRDGRWAADAGGQTGAAGLAGYALGQRVPYQHRFWAAIAGVGLIPTALAEVF